MMKNYNLSTISVVTQITSNQNCFLRQVSNKFRRKHRQLTPKILLENFQINHMLNVICDKCAKLRQMQMNDTFLLDSILCCDAIHYNYTFMHTQILFAFGN